MMWRDLSDDWDDVGQKVPVVADGLDPRLAGVGLAELEVDCADRV